ncbi:MAG: hypothetical protein AB1801_18550 [Chloroflexota bacterium]
MTVMLIIVCLVGLLALAGVVVVIVLVMQSGERDVVSTARQGWLNRRSGQDEEG